MSGNIIHDIFDEAQRGYKNISTNSNAKRNTTKLLKLLEGDRAQEAFMSICQCYDKVLSCGKKEAAAELTVRFFVTLASTSLQNENVFLSFINYLLERTKSLDKIVRFRACQTISCIFNELTEEMIDGVLCDTVAETLLPRLRDKCPNVRMWSVKALQDLIDPEDPKDSILLEFIRLMESDSSKDVRIAAINCTILSKYSLLHLIDRLKDIKTEVRIAAVQKLVDMVEINHLTQSQRGIVIKYALNDREEAVREKALQLIVKWLHSPAVDNHVPKLLHLIGLTDNASESELTAWSLIEAGTVNKEFNVTISKVEKTVSMKDHVENDFMNWQRSFTGIPPSEMLWTLLRCDFYCKSFSEDAFLERVESFLPDTVVLCKLLKEGHTLLRDENCPQIHEISMEYLLRITAFVDTSDIAGSKALISTCKDMLKDLKFLETLVEPVLTACSKAMNLVGSNVGDEMSVISQELWPSVFDSEMSEENPFKAKNPDVDLAQLRSLQIAAWTIQNQTAHSCSSAQGVGDATALEGFIPMIMQSLQQPIKELRSAALRCLGLLGISSQIHCENFAGIVLQVASAHQEDSFIRCQAIESLADMALVHSEELISQDSLVTLLLRMIDCGVTSIQRVAVEASAKLLFSGRIVKSAPLFSRLVRIFFCPIECEDNEFESVTNYSNPNNKKSEIWKDSKGYLDQLLSVFFPAFFSSGWNRWEIVVDSVACLISHCVMNVRDGVTTSVPLQKMIEHLLAWGDLLPSPSSDDSENGAGTIEQKMKIRLCSVCFKEILSLDSASPSGRLLLKELSKLFAALTPCDWISNIHMANTIQSLCRFVKSRCMLDKVSSKHLQTFYQACKEFTASAVSLPDDNASENILTISPGLSEMVADWSDTEELDEDTDINSCDESMEEAETFVPARSRIARCSKKQAESKISKQMCDENVNNSTNNLLTNNGKVLSATDIEVDLQDSL